MDKNNQNTTDSTGPGRSFNKILLSGLAAVLVVLIVVVYFAYMYQKDQREKLSYEENQDFFAALSRGGEYLESGDSGAAAQVFDQMLQNAKNTEQEGVAKLNLAMVRLRSDRIEAVQMLKEVSLNENYAEFTRAKAFYYILMEYLGTKDQAFASAHIFTGPVWQDFTVDGQTLDVAALRAFEYSLDVETTFEAQARLATEYAKLLFAERDQSIKDAYAQKIQEYVSSAQASIERVALDNRVRYGDTHYTEIAVAYHNLALASDALYFQGYLADPNVVEGFFQDAIDTYIANTVGDPSSGELYSRYFYADFLLRLASEGYEDAIIRILLPMSKLDSSYNVAVFVTGRLMDANYVGAENEPAQADNIARLANISPEFKASLLRLGVGEQYFAE